MIFKGRRTHKDSKSRVALTVREKQESGINDV